MNRYVCIHGHFYQPPRENAWLEEIEIQESAQPFHDWNERVNYECYEPNTTSRILGEKGKITKIVNNYSRISFNFGPTLLHWMDKHAPEVYQSILAADRESAERYDGHGNALAQVYNHIIMPLANRHDKETQIIWGIEDFESRFGRYPEGMWLAETAVDTETLELLARHDVRFTILAPRQAAAVRPIDGNEWINVTTETLDTTQLYLCQLPSGRTITLFFYHGDLAREVAFNGLLKDGKVFANRILESFTGQQEGKLIHIATDGESYGHHHRQGDMALAYCIDYLESNNLATITNYGQYLDQVAPEMEVRIVEHSSWSCAHGVERWRSNCGCNTGTHPGWQQEWRKPLRESLDWLRDQLVGVFERTMAEYCSDPWKVRNEYYHVIRDRSTANINAFLDEHIIGQKLNKRTKSRILRLLEMQRNAMLMYTSCGWFFDEISGIETTQIMQYANRAIQLAEQEGDIHLEEEFKKRLELAPSNVASLSDGRNIYEQLVEPRRLTLSKVGMHYAVVSLFSNEPEKQDILNYRAKSQFFDRMEAGMLRMAIGRTQVRSRITLSQKRYSFAAIYLGQHYIIGTVADAMTEQTFHEMYDRLKDTFINDSLANCIGVMEQYFGNRRFSLRSLFKDEQHKVLKQLLEQDLELASDSYKKIYNRNYNLLTVLHKEGIALPMLLRENLQVVINNDLMRYFSENQRSVLRLQTMVRDTQKWDITMDDEGLGFAASNHVLYWMQQIESDPTDLEQMQVLIKKLKLISSLGLKMDLYKTQNVYYTLSKNFIQQVIGQTGEPESEEKLVATFTELGERINVDFTGHLKAAW